MGAATAPECEAELKLSLSLRVWREVCGCPAEALEDAGLVLDEDLDGDCDFERDVLGRRIAATGLALLFLLPFEGLRLEDGDTNGRSVLLPSSSSSSSSSSLVNTSSTDSCSSCSPVSPSSKPFQVTRLIKVNTAARLTLSVT